MTAPTISMAIASSSSLWSPSSLFGVESKSCSLSAETSAMLISLVSPTTALSTVATIDSVSEVPGASGSTNDQTPLLNVPLPDGVAETNVIPLGNVSVTSTPVASVFELLATFVTVSVKVTSSPAFAVAELTTFANSTSTNSPTVICALSSSSSLWSPSSLPGVESMSVSSCELTSATFSITVPPLRPLLTLVSSVNVSVSPGAKGLARVQVSLR